jgi:uncharacterized membrane-anchored protein YjiN (DUF445 family)
MGKEFINNPVTAYEKLMNDYAELQTENDRLKEEIEQTLQEIKTIAERKITYIDFTKSKSCAELEQDYARINYELEQKIFEILQKIFKAEEE